MGLTLLKNRQSIRRSTKETSTAPLFEAATLPSWWAQVFLTAGRLVARRSAFKWPGRALFVLASSAVLAACAAGTFILQDSRTVTVEGMVLQIEEGIVEHESDDVQPLPRRHVIIGGTQYLCQDDTVSDEDCARIMLRLFRDMQQDGDY